MANRRDRTPALFGVRMQRVWHDPDSSTEWGVRFGWLTAFVCKSEPSAGYPGEVAWRIEAKGQEVLDGTAASVDAAARIIETQLRKVGRALPAAAIVTRKEWIKNV